MFRYNTSSLDTSILIRIITDDIPRQRIRAEKLITKEGHTYLIDPVAIMETIHVLETCYSLSREEIVDSLVSIFNTNSIETDRDLYEKVFPLYLAHPKLSFNDIYLSVKSEQSSAEPLWTFDKKLAAQLPSPKLI